MDDDPPGAYDMIGDIHGCRDELLLLLERLGYRIDRSDDQATWMAPAGRKAIFLGDLVNRGPESPGVLRLVMRMVDVGIALCVAGNHDILLLRRLQGREVDKPEALAESLVQLEREPPEFRRDIVRFIAGLPAYLILENGRLVVAHAGLPAEYQARDSEAGRRFAVNGREVIDEKGQPGHYEWAEEYKGEAAVVYGHAPHERLEWLNNTLCIDTGCVYGGRLTALRYPEMETVSVAAARTYYRSRRSESLRAAATKHEG
jgi:protein phosphatase